MKVRNPNMQREIKFRAWYPEMKRMFYQDGGYYTSLEYATWSFPLEIDESNDKRWSLNEDSVLMQFTGLKDKNGKEIWEGDRVMYNVPFMVEWCDGGFVLVSELSGMKIAIHPNQELEVIGNIYEHGHLLEKS